MKTYHLEKKWIWEHEEFPNFTYESQNLEQLYFKFGQLKMIESFMNVSDAKELLLEVLTSETVATSAIEGEMLQRSSVRSSINQILRLGLEEDYHSTHQSDALVEIVVDAKINLEPLDKLRLSSWHKALFPTNQSRLQTITAGSYRTHKEEMKIVSGSWEKEKVHYVAPPSSEMEKMMENFFKWLNEKEEKALVKAIVAHLYFVLIHPFEDGNGRMARAITDYLLAKESVVNANFYSMATAIYNNRKEYYEVLDKVCQNDSMDITLWVEWFIGILHESVDTTLKQVEVVKVKTQFWNRHLQIKLNERQKKVILKMLAYLPSEFEGGMKVSKYMNMTKCTRLTASRDLADLTHKNVMKVVGAGRTTSYVLVFVSKN